MRYTPDSGFSKQVNSIIREVFDSKTPKIVPNVIDGKSYFGRNIKKQISPIDNKKVICEYSETSETQLNLFLENFTRYKKSISSLSEKDITNIFTKASSLLVDKYADKIMAYTIIGQGKSQYEAEIDAVCELGDFWNFNTDYYKSIIEKQPFSPIDCVNESVYNPLHGFVAAITPFNFTAIGGNLATVPLFFKNVTIWKPANNAILSNYLVYQIMLEAGMPEEAIAFTPSDPNLFTQVGIIEENTKKILNPIFKSSFSVGFIFGGSISSIAMGLQISPVITTFITGSIVFLSSITMFFYGLKRKYDIQNDNPSFVLPSSKIVMFASINMCIFACMGIIVQWSPLWLVNDLKAPLFLVGSIVILFNLGEIISNIFASKLIRLFNEKIVGPYFAMLGSVILLLSVISQNILIIYVAVILFGFLISNVMPIVNRQSIKFSPYSIPVTMSHVTSISFTGVIFGPALVGLSAEIFGLTFNMYLLGILMFLISSLMLLIMNTSDSTAQKIN